MTDYAASRGFSANSGVQAVFDESANDPAVTTQRHSRARATRRWRNLPSGSIPNPVSQ